jgi:hypothetical protein
MRSLVALLHGHEKGGSAIDDGHARIIRQVTACQRCALSVRNGSPTACLIRA